MKIKLSFILILFVIVCFSFSSCSTLTSLGESMDSIVDSVSGREEAQELMAGIDDYERGYYGGALFKLKRLAEQGLPRKIS